jgi:cysteine desulfuration protein SufE
MNDVRTIEQRAEAIVSDFALFDDWIGRYEYLIELGGSLAPIDPEYKTDEYRVRGCQSQVWLKPEVRDGLVFFTADSDAIITRGLVALLVKVFDGQPPAAIAGARMDFLEEIGMNEHLSSTRKNGLASMVNRIKDYATQLLLSND